MKGMKWVFRSAEGLQLLGEQVAGEAATILSSRAGRTPPPVVPRIPAGGDRPWSVVLTGPYNTGKSSVAFVLTGDRASSSTRTSPLPRPTATPGRGTPGASSAVEIVDTPGVRTGDLSHDEIAETAVRDADLVLFLISPNFFDDTLASYFRHVALELSKAGADDRGRQQVDPGGEYPEIREDEVRKALGPDYELPLIVSCDAKSHLEAESATDPDLRGLALRRSNWGAFETAVAEFVTARAGAGRLRKPFDAVLAVRPGCAGVPGAERNPVRCSGSVRSPAAGPRPVPGALTGRFEDVYDRLGQSVANAGESVRRRRATGSPRERPSTSSTGPYLRSARASAPSSFALREELVALEADEHRSQKARSRPADRSPRRGSGRVAALTSVPQALTLHLTRC